MKKIGAVLLSVGLLLAGCSQETPQKQDNGSLMELQNIILSLEQENESLAKENDELKKTLEAYESTLEVPETLPFDEVENAALISFDQTITAGDVIEFTMKSMYWAESLGDSQASEYHYYGDEEGSQYFIVEGVVKNLSDKTIDILYASYAELLLGTYKYKMDWVGQRATGSDYEGSRLTPLQEIPCYFVVSVSDVLVEKKLDWKLKFGFIDLAQYVYSFEHCEYVYVLDNQ